MKTIAGVVAFVGAILVVGASFTAFETYMTDERRASVRGAVNDRLDQNAARYEEDRENGCRRRRCGFFASMSHTIASLRDGVFLSTPFDPNAVFPDAPAGWTRSPYDLGTIETIIDRKLDQTIRVSSTEYRLLTYFSNVHNADQVGAVQVYSQGDRHIAMAIKASLDGIRSAKNGERLAADRPGAHFATIDGLSLRVHPQISRDLLRDTVKPVRYRHFSMDIDGQVQVTIIGLSENEDVHTFLAGFDLSPIITTLPLAPANFTPGVGLVATDGGEDQEG